MTEWAPFEDMLEEGSVPVNGMRILTVMDESGNQWVEWRYGGEPSIEETVSLLSRLTFLVQMNEFLHTNSGFLEEVTREDDEEL